MVYDSAKGSLIRCIDGKNKQRNIYKKFKILRDLKEGSPISLYYILS